MGFGRHFPDTATPVNVSREGVRADQLPLNPKSSPDMGSTNQPLPYTFAPLISVKPDGTLDFGHISKIAPSLVSSIHASIAHFKTSIADGPSRSSTAKILAHSIQRCAYTAFHRAHTRWTLAQPKRYACGSCYNAGRACLMWAGGDKWMVLPLPERVRGEAVWTEEGYYTKSGSHEKDSREIQGVWLSSSKAKGRR